MAVADLTPQDMAANLLASGFERNGPSVAALSDPIADTPMVVTLDQLRPYDHDPRVTRNPAYEDIKASIRERGLDAPPAITRRPGEPHYIIRNGGNTRLAILRELWSETKDERFFRIPCLFRPWPQRGEVVMLTGHLAENELRGGLSFIERALGVEKAREFYEQEMGRDSGQPLSQSEVNDSVIRAVVSPRQQKMNQGSVYTDYGGQIEKTLPNVVTRGAGDLGLTMGSLGFFPAMDVVRQALPMVLSLLKMALVICIPLVLVFGTYELKALVAVSCVQFALFFVDFWFQLARWLDSTILDALYGWGFGANRPHSNFDPLIGLNNAFGDMLLNFVMATMFIVLPTFWVAALGWVGVRAGTAIQGLAAGTRDAQAAGGRGAGVAMKAAK
jgi:hypothetical protein